MQINTKKYLRHKELFLIVGTSLLLIVAGLAVYLYAFKGTVFGWSPLIAQVQDSSINYDKPSKEQKKAGEATKENSTNPVEDESKPISGSDQPSTPVAQPGGKSKVAITLTAPADKNVPSSFAVRALIGAVVNSGTCTLTFTKTGSDTITKTSGVQPQASVSTCQGFDITLSPGTWQMSLHFENEKLIGDTSQTVMVQ